MSLGGREGGTSAALYLIEGSTLREAGAINGIATLDASGTLTPDQVPASIANGLTFQAEWNAATNTPTLPPVSTPDPGDYWIVTTAGSTALPGAAGPWTVGQVAVFNGVDWDALSMYPLAVGLPVAGASAGDVLYVNGSAVLAYAAPGTTSGVQAYSAALAAIATNGTPSAWGLARMLDANQAANQTALGLGTIATQASNNVSITGGSITGITDLAVADGGTGGSTPAAARDGVLWASAAAIDPASPYTVAAGIDLVTLTSSKTVIPRALSNYADGQMIRVYNSSASTITVTITPTDGTIDGGASVALSCPAKGVVGCVRLNASAWGPVQPGSVGSPSVRLRGYVTGGTVTGVLEVLSGGSWVTAKSLGTATKTAGTAAIGSLASGDGFDLPAGYATAADQMSEGDRWIFDLAGAGVTWTPGADSRFVITYTGSQPTGTANHYAAGGYCGHTTPGSGAGLYVGYGRAASTIQVIGGINDGATTAGTCTGTAPAQGVLSWIGSASAYAADVRGRAAASMPTANVGDPTGQTVGTLGFGFVTLRRALGGGAATITGAEVCVYPAAGEVSW